MSFPLVYVNGCSYSDKNYRAEMNGRTYGDFFTNLVDGYLINRAVAGSCNRRIIRTTAHDLIQQRRLNPTQRIISLIQLTFEVRDEIWIDHNSTMIDACESNFRPHQFSSDRDWKEKLLQNKLIMSRYNFNTDKEFLQRWSEGRAYFYNSYAQRINLMLDLLLLTKLLQSLNISYLIFQGPQVEILEAEYLKDFFQEELNQDSGIVPIDQLNFCSWCGEHGFKPFDDEPLSIGHYGPDAHESFAEVFIRSKI